jgi:DNA mismatch repair protein MutS2
MKIPQKTLIDLEWDRLLRHLADRCSSSAAETRCLNLPFLDEAEAKNHLHLVNEFLACMERGDHPPSLPAGSVEEWLLRIQRGGAVTGESLRIIAKNIKLYVAICRYLDNRRDAAPKNAALVMPPEGNPLLVKLANLAAEIETAFEPDGTISDNASTTLSKLRARAVTLRNRLSQRIEKIAEREQDLLQDRTIGVKNDRFVLMVRADAHRRLGGIVHGSSGSGATIFIEPEEIISAGNDLTLALEEITREELRIISELAEAVRFELDTVRTACRVIVEVEVRIAAARLASDIEAHIPTPAKSGEVALLRARHPLLLLSGVNVVPSSIHLSRGECVVVSGPNAGGKTVVIKTVGLLGLMLAAGLPIPADPDSKMGIPRSVLTDIGDDQSLKDNLSTFSAHMTNISSIIAKTGPGKLVLLDELAAGTDPGEGAALAEAILETLCKKGSTALATTHFDALKTRAQGKGPFRNAAVGFDIETMQPTFDLTEGVPGSSSALAVARRFGAPDDVIERAKALIPGASIRLESAIQALEEERKRLLRERRTAMDVRRGIESLEKEKQKEIARLKKREEKFLTAESETLWKEIRLARERVSEAEKAVKRQRRDAKVLSQSRRTINAAAETLAASHLNKEATEALPGRPAKKEELTPGTAVFVTTFGKKGVVASPTKGKNVFVTIGPLKTRVDISDLRIIAETKETTRPRVQTASAAVTRREDPIQTSRNTVDLRGMTGDEAVDATDAFLDKAMNEDQGYAFIIHGHGTGVLKDAIRSYVETSPYADEWRPGERGEGGDGVTVVWLR